MKNTMRTYCLLKNGEIVIIHSDNTDEKTIHAYSLSEKDNLDVEWDTLKEYKYSEIKLIHPSLAYLQAS